MSRSVGAARVLASPMCPVAGVTPPGGQPCAAVVLPGAQSERQHKKRNAECERIGAEPPGQDDCPNHWRNRQQYAKDDRHDTRDGEPPAAVILAQPESGADHQAARDERPSSQQQHEGDHRQAGHEKRDHADERC